MSDFILLTSSAPASRMELAGGLVRFKKELVKVGHYVKESAKQEINITLSMLNHWVKEFDRWIANGNKVPIPLGHEREYEPEFNRGWVTSMYVEGNSLFGILELSDPELAKTTDVSIAVPKTFTDGKGVKYNQPIVHVALTTVPVVGGLTNFVKLSLSKGEHNMSLLEKIAKSLGLKEDKPTEDAVILALETKLKTPDPDPDKDKTKTLDADAITAAVALALAEKDPDKTKAPDKEAIAAAVKLALADKDQTSNDPLAQLVGENREMKLSNFVKAGLITPAVKDVIVARYIETKALALELSSKTPDTSFDFLCEVLSSNKPIKLASDTGMQTVELANGQKAEVSVMKLAVANKRKDAGLKD